MPVNHDSENWSYICSDRFMILSYFKLCKIIISVIFIPSFLPCFIFSAALGSTTEADDRLHVASGTPEKTHAL